MRLIDADKIQFSEIDEIGGEYEPYLGCSKRQIDNLPTVEAIPKDQYKARLKADLKAILVEFQLEIKEVVKEEELIDKKWANGLHYSEKIIQQKINSMGEINHEH